jgi:hypothetical protein
VTTRAIHPISVEYLDKNPEVAEENVALLKNAIELWRSAAQTNRCNCAHIISLFLALF